jgi:isopentenyl phosphate kinase
LPTELIVLKLGGSLITNKDVPLSLKHSALKGVARAIYQSGLPNQKKKLFLVHGGGSFGHYYAQKFHLSTKPTRVGPFGIAQTTAAMFSLHSKVVESLLCNGVKTETILPSELLEKDLLHLSNQGIKHVQNSFGNDLIPISFGHVGLCGANAFIISGDVICKAITKSLGARRVIFAMDVDGVYPNSNLEGKIITRLSQSDTVLTQKRTFDVTGGVGSKVELGFELLDLGAEVFYVNGTKPARLKNLLAGRVEKVVTQIVSQP